MPSCMLGAQVIGTRGLSKWELLKTSLAQLLCKQEARLVMNGSFSEA